MTKKILCSILIFATLFVNTCFAETEIDEQLTQENIEIENVSADVNADENQEILTEIVIEDEISEDGAENDISIEVIDENETTADVIIRPATSTVIEIEDYYQGEGSRIATDSNASGGKFIKNTWGPQQTEEISFTVSAEVEGDYYVNLVANGGGAAGGAISNWTFKVNDNSVYTITSISTPCSWEFGDIFKMSTFTGATVHLTEGINTVILSVPPSTGGGSVVKYMADCVVFYQPKNITDVIIECPDIVKVGQQISVVAYSQDGEALISTDYDSIEFSTETPKFIKIVGTNAVALNHGKGIVNVTVNAAGRTFISTKEINVAASNGLCMQSLKRVHNEEENKDEIVVTVKACGNYTGGGNIIIAGYQMKNGLKTLMNPYTTVAMTAMADGEVKEYKIDAAGYTEDMTVNAFLFAGRINTLRVIAVLQGLE